MTASDIKQALYAKYANPEQYIALAEFCPGTCAAKNQADRYFDFYVINCYGDCNTIAFEIKVSRSDFLSELKKPDKKRLALHYSNEFYFVAPKGLIKPEELPNDCGLIEASEEDDRISLHTKRQAIIRESGRPTWRFVAGLSRVLTKNALQRFQAERQELVSKTFAATGERDHQYNRAHWLWQDLDVITKNMTDEELQAKGYIRHYRRGEKFA